MLSDSVSDHLIFKSLLGYIYNESPSLPSFLNSMLGGELQYKFGDLFLNHQILISSILFHTLCLIAFVEINLHG